MIHLPVRCDYGQRRTVHYHPKQLVSANLSVTLYGVLLPLHLYGFPTFLLGCPTILFKLLQPCGWLWCPFLSPPQLSVWLMGSNLTYCNASTKIQNAHTHRTKGRWVCAFYGIIEYILPLRQLLCRLSFYQYRQRGLRLYKILRCPDSPQNDFCSLLTHIIHI